MITRILDVGEALAPEARDSVEPVVGLLELLERVDAELDVQPLGERSVDGAHFGAGEF